MLSWQPVTTVEGMSFTCQRMVQGRRRARFQQQPKNQLNEVLLMLEKLLMLENREMDLVVKRGSLRMNHAKETCPLSKEDAAPVSKASTSSVNEGEVVSESNLYEPWMVVENHRCRVYQTAHNENVSDLKQGLAPRSRFESLAVGDLDERYVKRMNTELSKSHGLVKGTQGASGLLSFHSAIKTVEEGQVYGNPNKHPLKGMARGGKGVKDGARKGLKEVGVDGRGILGPHNNALIHCSESDDDGLWDGTYMEKMSDDVGSLERDMGNATVMQHLADPVKNYGVKWNNTFLSNCTDVSVQFGYDKWIRETVPLEHYVISRHELPLPNVFMVDMVTAQGEWRRASFDGILLASILMRIAAIKCTFLQFPSDSMGWNATISGQLSIKSTYGIRHGVEEGPNKDI
ncbi:hypothetical protein V6N13_142086 [Hibiscus sabdariffa]